jgi:hypothetical protein
MARPERTCRRRWHQRLWSIFAFTPIRRQVPKRPEEAAVLRKVDTKRLLVTQDVENALKVAETGDAGLD